MINAKYETLRTTQYAQRTKHELLNMFILNINYNILNYITEYIYIERERDL